jgi:hypothetical protein
VFEIAMTTAPHSPLETINIAIKDYNPFQKNAIVTAQNIWGQGFPDVESLNSDASQAVFKGIDWVKKNRSLQGKITSLVFTAEKGVGKSHLIGRIRHKLLRDGGTLFIYASADEYVDLNSIKYQFQKTVADSLKHENLQGIMQWQEVAFAMVNEVLSAQQSSASLGSAQTFISRFDRLYEQRVQESKKNLMLSLVEKFQQVHSNIDPDIIRAVFWTLSPKQEAFAIKWLAGQEISNAKADELSLPQNCYLHDADREIQALQNIKQILALVSCYSPVLICFDEIDVLDDCDDAGNRTPEVIADLVKRLYDTVQQSENSQGIILLTLMMPDTWRDLKQLKGGISDRLSYNGKSIDLQHMDSKSIFKLVQCWLNDFYRERNLVPPHEIYPFQEEQLYKLGKERPTVRQVIRWCSENFQVPEEELPQNPIERFDLGFNKELDLAKKESLDDNNRIADVLYFGFRTLEKRKIEDVEVEKIISGFGKRGGRDKYVNFKLIVKDKGKSLKIGVSVLQDNNGRGLGSGVKRLMEYDKLDINRGCLVRSPDRKIPQSWKQACEYIEQLTSPAMGGEYVPMVDEQIRPLLAIHSLFEKRDRYRLSKEQILDEIEKRNITIDNELLREILSDPSGQMPEMEEDDLSDLLSETSENSSESERHIHDKQSEEISSSKSDDDNLNDLFD